MTQGLTYHVDIVLCIDITGSMTPIIERVKDRAINFYQDVDRNLKAEGKHVDQLRVRVIGFRDFGEPSSQPIEESPFYVLPDEQDQFASFVKSLRADAGGDEAESGLEAFALALRSKWTTTGDKRRQVIVMWTDAPAHPLGTHIPPDQFRSQVPSSLDELFDLWESDQGGLVNTLAKRLVLFAPDAEGWSEIGEKWENVIHHPSRGGEGLGEHDYSQIMGFIAGSI